MTIEEISCKQRIDEFLKQPPVMVLRNLSAFLHSFTEEERQAHIEEIDIIRLVLLAHNHGRGFDMEPDDLDYYPRLLNEATQILMDFE